MAVTIPSKTRRVYALKSQALLLLAPSLLLLFYAYFAQYDFYNGLRTGARMAWGTEVYFFIFSICHFAIRYPLLVCG